MSTQNTQNLNPSTPDAQAQQPDANAELLARLDAQDKLIADLLAKQNAPTQPTPIDKGGVWVEQWRTIPTLGGSTEKVDVREQYYDADTFDKLNAKDEKDTSGFEYLGLGYKVKKDLRKK